MTDLVRGNSEIGSPRINFSFIYHTKLMIAQKITNDKHEQTTRQLRHGSDLVPETLRFSLRLFYSKFQNVP